jgi:argininosuccinate lyase
MRLWESPGISTNSAILSFTVGDDPELDRRLLAFDCLATAAHARMLAAIGVLGAEEAAALDRALREAYAQAVVGTLAIRPEQEDCHTALEEWLTARAGDAGRKVHTGRSRNDQVIAALRLYAREGLLQAADGVREAVEALLRRADEHRLTAMPGYTHTRQAMPSTLGQRFAAAAEGLIADLETMQPALEAASRGALGSASGYGVPLPLDRAMTARLLGLEGLDLNSLQVQDTRGRLEARALFGLHQVTLTLARLATDLIWWSSEAFGFVRLPDELTTGSSIMPNKRNPDVLELVRALPAAMGARYSEVTALLPGLGAGYHRDLQRTKGPLVRGLEEARAGLAVMALAVERLEVDVAACARALTPGIFATDAAYALVRRGVPFREAYQRVKAQGAGQVDAAAALAGRTHAGAPGTEQVPALRARLEAGTERLRPFVEGARVARSLLA